jgi:hypothetical protein
MAGSTGILWWLESFFHLETLFAIFLLWCVWFVFFKKGNTKATIESRAKDLLNILESAHTDPVGTVRKFSRSKSVVRTTKPKKKIYKHEERCREIFESIFDLEFPSCRPDFLKNPISGRNLELDGFCPSIKTHLGKGLAYEFDGAQHNRYTPRFHDSAKDFVGQVKRDLWKEKVCKDKGILLIRIPHYIRYDELDMFIVKELGKHHLV